MTTVISQKGQVVIPAAIREKLNLQPGDDLEVVIRDDRSIILERITRRPNEGLVDALLSGRGLNLEIPPREYEKDTREIPFQD